MAKGKKKKRSPGTGSAYTPPKGDPTRPRDDDIKPVSQRSAAASWLVAGLGVALILGFLGYSIWNSRDQAGSTEAASFDLPGLDGQPRVKLADYVGKPVVLNFFASWCTTCDQEIPHFRDAADALEGEVEFVFVNSNENGDWKAMASRNRILDYTLASDINGTQSNGLYLALGGRGGSMPITAFYDENGRAIDFVSGGFTRDTLAEALNRNFGVAFQ